MDILASSNIRSDKGVDMVDTNSMWLKELLANGDQAELVEWLRDHINGIERCLVILAKPDGDGGLNLSARQIGFKYLFEIQGFTDMAAELLHNEDELDLDPEEK